MIKKIIVVLTLFVSVISSAQKNNASAYSFFGIGDKNNTNTVEQISMGSIGVSLNDEFRLNLSNPASLSSLKFTTYSLAIENKNIWAKEGADTQHGATTYLSYLAMGVPLGENAGLSFGLLPNSSVGYSLTSNIYNTGSELTEISLYNGEGGTNKVFLGFGIQVFKGFSIGFQGNYIFGKIENSITNQLKDVSLGSKYETLSSLKGFSLDGGVQYKTELNKNSKALVTRGVNAGQIGTIESLEEGTFILPKRAVLNLGDKKIEIPTDIIMAVGLEAPVIQLK